MAKHFAALTVLVAAILTAGGMCIAHAQAAEITPAPMDDALEKICEKHALPGMAAAAMIEGRLVAIGAAGKRRAGGYEPATAEDKWHIGSCTKSMTSSLAAMLVADGKIAWSATVADIFPELRDTMDPAWAAVSLEQLLTHRGGAPGEAPPNLWRNAWAATGTPTEQRMEFVRGLLMRRPDAAPGEKFIYSNQGYAIAGAMLERATGRAWEDLLRERLFAPLKMTSAGFGAPGTAALVDQPWGHRRDGENAVPVPPGKNADNPVAIGPAGIVHCSVRDLVSYAAWHARAGRTTARMLSPASFAKLHTPIAGEPAYAFGWGVFPREWAHGTALTHNGSNTMWFAVMWIAPARDAAFVACTNIAGDAAEKGCDEAVSTMIQRFLKDDAAGNPHAK